MGQFTGYPAIVNGLPYAGTNLARPVVFTYNSELYLYSAGDNTAFKWNVTTEAWVTNTPFQTFNGTPYAYAEATVFTYNSELYLIEQKVSTPQGWKWNETGQQWEPDTAIVNGLSYTSTYPIPGVFFIDSTMYCLMGNSAGTTDGYIWNGSAWVTDSGITSGLDADTGAYNMLGVGYNGADLYLVLDAAFHYKWNRTTNQWDAANLGTLTENYKYTLFEWAGSFYLIAGDNSYLGYQYQLTGKINSLAAVEGTNLKAKLVLTLTEALEGGETLTAYVAPSAAGFGDPAYLVELTQTDSVTWEYQTDIEEGEQCYFQVNEIANEIEIDSGEYTGRFYITAAITPTVINITDAANYRVLNSPAHNNNHGLIQFNGFVFGSARNSPTLGEADIFKIDVTDYSSYLQQTIFKNKTAQTLRTYGYDQIIQAGGFLWVNTQAYLVRINPADLDYMVFDGLPSSTHREPLATDGDYIYMTSGLTVTKLDVSLLTGSFASYGYDGSYSVVIPPAAIVDTCTFNQLHPTENVYCHSIITDDLYLYCNQSTPASTLSGYDDSLGINMCHVQKIRKADMVSVGDVTIPRCTDDMVQNNQYLFLGPELGTGAIAEQLGYDWGLLAINKQTLEIKYLKTIVPANDTALTDRSLYGLFIVGGKIIIQTNATLKYTLVIDISEIESWGANLPFGYATEGIFTFQLNGTGFTVACNELVVDNAGYVHTNTWETDTMVFKFTLDTLTTADPEPVIQTTLISSDDANATVQGAILDTGQSAMTSVGFRYGTAPDTLSTNVPATLGTTFEETISSLTPGIYYIQAWGTNTEGTFYGNTVVFSTYNALKLTYDTDDAVLEWLDEKHGLSIRCVQDAPGVADGVTGTATDADGNTYNTIVINQKRWFVENLKTTKYRNGESIPEVTDNSAWAALTTGARSFYENAE
ncbi:hypothetical protein OU798_07320 [Prolixibacteraceae bacterium Z1-6]|uniref:Uncharacterized protein n=1 Tax=Draconibacterium aestuarii TaxID=2998507 RepID=A0A9X3F771_9BACT|nr:hypothetical protein [Prolixibacteraceae bacterium Z1-6]